MLKRKAYRDLIKWKNNANKKALCVIGARQIGKTTLIREFVLTSFFFTPDAFSERIEKKAL